MAKIWSCQATVKTKVPMTTPGYNNLSTFSVSVKVRTETAQEPSPESILTKAKFLMDTCYAVEVIDISDPTTNFLLWDNI